MNYTIFVRPQEERTLPSGARNMGSPPVYPAGAYLVWRSPAQNIYSAIPSERAELISDPNGIATVADVKANLPQLVDYRLKLIEQEAERRIDSLYSRQVQINCAMGLYNSLDTAAIQNGIAGVMSKAYAADDAINSATTIDELLAVQMEA